MGADAGFDIVPALTESETDQQKWAAFIQDVMKRFSDDALVQFNPNFIEFQVAKHPKLPMIGHKFLSFSSKITGRDGDEVEEYIRSVRRIARDHFGNRIIFWNELHDVFGHYGWSEVRKSIESYHSADAAVQVSNQPIFVLQDIEGKGRGLIARCNIARGVRIIAEKPLLITASLSPLDAMEATIVTKLKTLSKADQRQLVELHNNFPGKYPFSGIVKTNALPCGPDSPTGGVYPTISRINHACLSNSHNNWNAQTQTETIHALRDIASGEEITIAYKHGPSNTRRMNLKTAFGFACACALCTSEPSILHASDARRREIERLDAAIGDPMRALSNPSGVLANCHTLFSVLNAEFSNGTAQNLIARLYYDAFQICIINSDIARASVFAERACTCRTVCEGEDSPETQRMKSLADRPESHMSFGMSKRWRSTKGLKPKGLSEEEFDKWLWRRA